MPYAPLPLTFFIPPINVTNGAYEQTWRNHQELYELYEGAIAQHSTIPAVYSSTSEVDVWRFKSRGGADYVQGMQLRLQVYAAGTGAGGTVKLNGGASAVGVSVSGAAALYDIDATPDSANDEWVITQAAAPSGTLTIYGWTAFWLPTVGNDDFDSNYRQGWAGWYAANAAVHTEAMGRLVGGPSFIARDRPICIFQHFARVNVNISAFVKQGFEQYWGAYDRDYQEASGFARIPRADIRPRPYRIDWFLRASSTATAQIAIGGQTIDITTPNAWGSAVVQLSPGDHPLLASVVPGLNEWAYFEALQVWRAAL
jgi:hypothetical protein